MSFTLFRLFNSQLMFSPSTLCTWTMIVKHTTYLQCQCSVPMLEAVCPLCNEAKTKGVGVGLGELCCAFNLHARDQNSHHISSQTSLLFFLLLTILPSFFPITLSLEVLAHVLASEQLLNTGLVLEYCKLIFIWFRPSYVCVCHCVYVRVPDLCSRHMQVV